MNLKTKLPNGIRQLIGVSYGSYFLVEECFGTALHIVVDFCLHKQC